MCVFFFFFKQKTAYEMRISDWSSDVCSSDLERFVEGDDDVFRAFAFEQFEQETGEAVHRVGRPAIGVVELVGHRMPGPEHVQAGVDQVQGRARGRGHARAQPGVQSVSRAAASGRSRSGTSIIGVPMWTKPTTRSCSPIPSRACACGSWRSEEHTSELQSLMRISYA